MTVIVALVEEGGADVNLQTTETGDTPLILSVSSILNHYSLSILSRHFGLFSIPLKIVAVEIDKSVTILMSHTSPS